MAVAAGCILFGQPGGRAGRVWSSPSRPARSCCARVAAPGWTRAATWIGQRRPLRRGFSFAAVIMLTSRLEVPLGKRFRPARIRDADKQAFQRARLDMTASDALAAVNLVQHE